MEIRHKIVNGVRVPHLVRRLAKSEDEVFQLNFPTETEEQVLHKFVLSTDSFLVPR